VRESRAQPLGAAVKLAVVLGALVGMTDALLFDWYGMFITVPVCLALGFFADRLVQR
jgi:hypothetical protein